MEKSCKRQRRCTLLRAEQALVSRSFLRATVFSVAFLFLQTTFAAQSVAQPKPPLATTVPKAENQLETYQDLVQKAQNLTLQQDRLQTSQVLLRGIQRESRGSPAYRELVRVLDDLTSVFYTEKAQNLFATAESVVETKPREAIEQYQEAYKSEDRNVSILKGLARAHLRLNECDRAEARVRSAEEVNPYSGEVKLLRLQTLACQKNFDVLATRLSARDPELETLEKNLRGLQILDLWHRKESKKAKALVMTWESQSPEYPEVYFWKWEISKDQETTDRVAAGKYVQLCQNLTPRKRKSFSLDVSLCKGKEAAELFLKQKETQSAPPAAGEGSNQ